MASNFSVAVNINGKVAPSLGEAVNTVKSRLAGITKGIQAQSAAQVAAVRRVQGAFSGLAGAAAGIGLAMGARSIVEATSSFQAATTALKNAGRTGAESAEGLREAWKVFGELPTSNISEIVNVLNETTGALGSFDHAVANLKSNVKIGEVLKATLHVENPGHALAQLSSFAELAGRANDPAKYQRLLGDSVKAMTFFNGRVTAEDFKTFASNATGSVSLLSDRFLTKILPSMIQETSADKVGTGLTGFGRLISGQRITDKGQVKAWASLGLLNPADVITNPKNGELKGWKAGAIKGTDLAFSDPLAFVEKFILPRLTATGTNINDQVSLKKGLSQLFKDKKAFDFVWSLATEANRARLHKDEGLIGKVLGVDEQLTNIVQTLSVAIGGLSDAFKGLAVAIFGPSAGGLGAAINRVSLGVRNLAEIVTNHPGLGKALAAIGAGLAVLLSATLANSIFNFVGLARVLGALALTLSNPIGWTVGIVGALYALKELNPGDIVGKTNALTEAVGRLQSKFAEHVDIEGWLERTIGTPADVGAAMTRMVDAVQAGLDSLRQKFDAAASAAVKALLSVDWIGVGRQIVDSIASALAALPGKVAASVRSGIGSLGGMLGGFLGGAPKEAPIPHADGGPVVPRTMYLVGERGPELFWSGGASGTIIPNGGFSNLVGGGFGAGGTFGAGVGGRAIAAALGLPAGPDSIGDKSYSFGGLRLKSGESIGGGAADAGIVALAKHLQTTDPQFSMFSALNDRFHHGLGYHSKHTDGLAFDAVMKDGRYGAARGRMNAYLNSLGFVPGRDYWIEPGTGNHLHTQFQSHAAAAAYAAKVGAARRGGSSAPVHAPTYNAHVVVNGKHDAGAVREEVYAAFRRLEREQRGALSD